MLFVIIEVHLVCQECGQLLEYGEYYDHDLRGPGLRIGRDIDERWDYCGCRDDELRYKYELGYEY